MIHSSICKKQKRAKAKNEKFSSSPFFCTFSRDFSSSTSPPPFFSLLFDVCHRFLLIFNQRFSLRSTPSGISLSSLAIVVIFMLFLCWFFFYNRCFLPPPRFFFFGVCKLHKVNLMLLSSIIDYLISGKGKCKNYALIKL